MTRSDLFRLPALFGQFPKEFDEFFKMRPFVDEETTGATSAWIPLVDIKEEADKFVIHADIPGVDPKDIDITMEKGILTIKGERETAKEDERQNYKRVERTKGTFYRRFTLPDSVDAEKITATGKHGVLEVIIPKLPVVQPRRININVVEETAH